MPGGGGGGELLYNELVGTRRTSLGVRKAGFWNLTLTSKKEERAFTVSTLYDTLPFVFAASLSKGMA